MTVEHSVVVTHPINHCKNVDQLPNNMDMQDVAAELSADISPEEKFSIYEFCKEWERDPGHVAFVQRLHNTPDVNSIDEIAKGQIVYDLMDRPGPGGIMNLPTVTRQNVPSCT